MSDVPVTPPHVIKICGITRVDDGLCALEAGANWLGFIRWPGSLRCRPLDECRETLAALRARAPRPFAAVGVFVDEQFDHIEAEAESLGLDRVQLHGDEPPELLAALSRPVLKVLKIRDEDSLAEADAFPGVDLLADAWDPAMPGGTGRRYDYHLLKDLAARRRVIVAGGLDAENVARIVETLRPWGVDVSSKVEIEPGLKDHEKVRRFVDAARRALEGATP